jgi:UPF0271 protein
MSVDLNCDLGEGAGHDGHLMLLITSANIACGAHAGDRATMCTAAEVATFAGVAIGAHPGYADRENFGRREIALTPGELGRLVTDQIGALQAFGRVRHVKPHGALYNLAARDRAVADVIATAVHAIDPELILFGLAGSELVRAGRRHGLHVAEEVFGDRTYRRDGSLTPRSEAGAMIEREEEAVAQVLRMVREGVVRATDGTDVAIKADTICLHGDDARAVEFAEKIRAGLEAAEVEIKAFGTANGR